MDKAAEEGSLAKAGRGVYHVPTETILGPSVLPPMRIIGKEYLAYGDDVYGCWSGLMLENQMGLTTQNPSVLEIVTNKAIKRVRSLGQVAGHKDVVIRQPRVKVSEDNAEVLMLLDLAKRTSRSDVREIISCECSQRTSSQRFMFFSFCSETGCLILI